MKELLEQIDKVSHELIDNVTIVTCQEENSLERVENLKYYFYGFKHDLADLLGNDQTLSDIRIEDAILANGYLLEMPVVNQNEDV